MCTAHRRIVSATVALWVLVLVLVFWAQPEPGPWRMMTYAVIGLAVVMVPYCLYPWLVRDMMKDQLEDMAGAFLTGWEAHKEHVEPREPRRLTVAR